MIFDVEQINEEGIDFQLFESKDLFNLDSPESILIEDVKAQGNLQKSGKTILCSGSLQTRLATDCTRCLRTFSFELRACISLQFIPRTHDKNLGDEVELNGIDVEQEFYENGQINLTNPVRDLIILSLPQVLLCREDCAGLCSECGANQNDSKCVCKDGGSVDLRFAVLEQLKNKLN